MRDTVFLSRSSQDRGAAQQLVSAFEAAGLRVLTQDFDIRTGDDFKAFMDSALRTTHATIALISRAYLASDWCRREALAADGLADHQLIPLVIEEGCRPDGLLASLVYCDVTALLATSPPMVAALVVEILRSGRPLAEASPARAYLRTANFVTNVSFNDSAVFVGRKAYLEELEDALWRGQAAAAITQAAALHGLGGIGKTTLAVEYARQNRHRYRGIWRLRGEHANTLVQDLALLRRQLAPDALSEEPRDAARAALHEIERTPGRPFLLLFDNIETPDDMREWWPAAGAQVLITSRWGDWKASKARSIALETLDPTASIDLLVTLSNRTDRDRAGMLAETLGHLPLAICHAAAVLRQARGLTFDDYVHNLEARIASTPRGAGDYPAPVRGALESNLAMLARHAPGAEALLDLAAYCAPDAIPTSLWDTTPACTALPTGLRDRVRREESFGALETWSLTSQTLVEMPGGAKQQAVSLHRLTQAVIRARCAEAGRHVAVLNTALDALEALAGSSAELPSDTMDMVNPHANAVRAYISQHTSDAEICLLAERARALVARTTLHCTFCQRNRHEVTTLIMGPIGGICDDCVVSCDEFFAREGETTAGVICAFDGRQLVSEGDVGDRHGIALRHCTYCREPRTQDHNFLRHSEILVCDVCIDFCIEVLKNRGAKIIGRSAARWPSRFASRDWPLG